jgi:molecular chaperone DnaK (HSP70)
MPAVGLVLLLVPLAVLAGKNDFLIPVLDIGDEYMKVAAINTRGGDYPLLEVALNEQSERKTSVVVGFEQDGEMRVGEDGIALKVRAPTRCFYGLMELLGQSLDSYTATKFLDENPQFKHVVVSTERNTIAFKVHRCCVRAHGAGRRD